MYSIADYNNVIDKIDLSLLFHENSVEQKLEVLKIAQQTLSPSDLELFFIAHLNTCCNFDCSLYFHKVITHVYNYKYIYDFAEL